jgi:mRNA-degrading endonuclease RelE of RelBE toxin-antitoxin system
VEKLDREMRDRVSEKIDQLLKGSHIGEPLKGKRDYKKVRIGKYRLIYSDKEKCKIVLVKLVTEKQYTTNWIDHQIKRLR